MILATRNDILNDMERAFDAIWGAAPLPVDTFALDVIEQNGVILFEAAIPGMKVEDLNVHVEKNVLTIQGETKQSWEQTDDTKVYRREMRYGKFSRSMRLPEGLDVDKVEANYASGVLTVKIPKLPIEKIEPKRIPINVG